MATESPRPTDIHAGRLEALLKTTKALASDIHLDRVMIVVADQVTSVLDAERSSVLLYDEAHDELRGIVAQGMGTAELRFPADKGLAGYVAQSRTTLNVADAHEDPRFNAGYDARTGFRTRSVLTAPILSPGGKLIGVIQVLNKQTAAIFDEEDEILLEAFSAHASVAIERARFVEQYADQQRVKESMRVAHTIQTGLLPSNMPGGGTDDRFDLYAHLETAYSVGGDLYDFLQLDDDRLVFAVGDVSGKGVPAALFMNGTHSLLRLAAGDGHPPDRCFDQIQRVQMNRNSMFVTLFYGLLDLRSGRLAYGNAGHPPPCLVRGNGSAEFFPRARNLPLGVLRSPQFHVDEFDLSPGDLIILYTDGVLEATNPAGDEFGQERLLEAVHGAELLTAHEAVDRIIERVEAFAMDTPMRDDVTVLALRFDGAK